MPDPTKVAATRDDLKDLAGPSGFGSATSEERILAAADAGVTAVDWTGPTGATGVRGATGVTGPAGA